ncbi:MAG: hypothetical protein R6U68_11285 [Desulfobacteraceae bacterium]
MKSRTGFIFIFFFILFFSVLPRSQAMDRSSYPELTTFLESEYASPFQPAGTVKEISENRLIFDRSEIHLKRGRLLWVCENRPDISPVLQTRLALIKVEAVFKQMVIASVLEMGEKAIGINDTVVTPPSPVIHVYTNIKDKQGRKAYQDLITALLVQDMHVKEISGDVLDPTPDQSDLLLRLEYTSDQLVCRCVTPREEQLLFYETISSSNPMETLFPSGHKLKKYEKKSVSEAADTGVSAEKDSASGEDRSDFKTAASPPDLSASAAPQEQKAISSTFQKASKPDPTEFHRLSKMYYRSVACDLNGDGSQELALLRESGIDIFRLACNDITPVLSYEFSASNITPIHLHRADLDNLPGDELLVTLCREVEILDARDSEICSLILSFKNKTLEVLAEELPYYLRTITDKKGNTIALAQEKGDYSQFSGPVMEMTWNVDNRKINIKTPYNPAKGVYGIYQFNLKPDDNQRLMIIDPDASLRGYFAPEERIEASGTRNYGKFHELSYPVKLEEPEYLGGFDKETERALYTHRRFVYKPSFDHQCFTIYKERKGYTGLIDKAVEMIWTRDRGTDQVAGLKWINQQIVETWTSKKLSKNILDFTFIENPQRILLLYREENGCAVEILK